MATSTEGQTELAKEVAAQQLPDPDVAAERFPITVNKNPASDEDHAAAMDALAFGVNFGDYMAVADWSEDEGWSDQRVVPYGPLNLTPAAAVLHYAQEVFEGMKAYRWADGSIWTFRPGFNAARLNHSARRLAMPEIPLEDFIGSLVQVVRADERWVPSARNSSLYLRPFMIADESFVGVRPARHYKYVVIETPVGPYFKGGLAPVSIWVTTDYCRAAPGGTGDAKTGGNYAASLLPQQLASAKGFEQVCYLDPKTGRNLEELGGMNVFVIKKDGTTLTPKLTGSILEGGTRNAIIQLLEDKGTVVEEATIELEWLIDAVQSGEVIEMFACGTAAVVVPIGQLAGETFDVRIDGDSVTREILEELSGIQHGTIPDRYNWMYRLV